VLQTDKLKAQPSDASDRVAVSGGAEGTGGGPDETVVDGAGVNDTPTPVALEVAQILVYEAWAASIRAAAKRAAEDPNKRKEYLPPKATRTQLGTVRALALGLGVKQVEVNADSHVKVVGVDAPRAWIRGIREIKGARADTGDKKPQWSPEILAALEKLFAWDFPWGERSDLAIWKTLFGRDQLMPDGRGTPLRRFDMARLEVLAVREFLICAVRVEPKVVAQKEGDTA
jgi:hypothetical protein